MDKETLQRYVEGNVTLEEVLAVVDWLDADESHVREFKALHKLHDISLLNNPALPTVLPTREPAVSLRRIGYELAKIAAVFLICWGGFELFHSSPAEQASTALQTLYVPAGQRAELTLPDGTRVWLNARSKLVYPLNFGKDRRKVELNGEAYFDVTHDERHPFVVGTSQMNIHVLGTEFNVKAYALSPDFEVSLLKGSIELQSPGLPSPYRVKEKESVRIKGNKLAVGPIGDYDYFRWKEGLLCFNNESVATIIEKLRLYYDVDIYVHNRKFLASRYTGKFRTKDGIEQVLKVLQIEHKFTYTKDNERNIITIQ